MEPRYLDFGTMKPGQKATKTLSVSSKTLTNVSVEALLPLQNGFEPTVTPLTDSGTFKSQLVSVHFTAPQVQVREVIATTIRLTTSSERVPVMNFAVRGIVAPEIEISPAVLVLTPAINSDYSEITLQSEMPFQITRVSGIREANSNAIEITSADVNDVRAWSQEHRWRTQNSSLSDVVRINVELQVRNSSGLSEARSVSIKVKRL